MSTETNKAIARRFFEEVYNKRNLAVIDQLLAPDIVNHSTGVRGLESVRLVMTSGLAKYPDVRVIFEDFIAEGDKVAIRGTDHFTDPSSGKKVSLPWIEIVRIEEGKLAEAWYQSDTIAYADILPAKGSG